MKSILKIFGILCLSIFVFTACSDDDDPVNNDFFIGRYNGKVSYKSADETKTSDNGHVQVVKVGDKYNFLFSDGIPNITGVEIEKNENSQMISEYSLRSLDRSEYLVYNKNNILWEASP